MNKDKFLLFELCPYPEVIITVIVSMSYIAMHKEQPKKNNAGNNFIEVESFRVLYFLLYYITYITARRVTEAPERILEV